MSTDAARRNSDFGIALLRVWLLLAVSVACAGVRVLMGQPQKYSDQYAEGPEWFAPYSIPYALSRSSFRVGDGCVEVLGIMRAGRFFVDLKRKKSAHGPVFRVRGRVVTDFPDQVLLAVSLASGVPCSRGGRFGPVYPSLDPFKSLRAEAVYIRDLRKHPLEISLEWEGDDPGPWLPKAFPGRFWYLNYKLQTKGVRLTDALLITLSSKAGAKIAELSWRQ